MARAVPPHGTYRQAQLRRIAGRPRTTRTTKPDKEKGGRKIRAALVVLRRPMSSAGPDTRGQKAYFITIDSWSRSVKGR